MTGHGDVMCFCENIVPIKMFALSYALNTTLASEAGRAGTSPSVSVSLVLLFSKFHKIPVISPPVYKLTQS